MESIPQPKALPATKSVTQQEQSSTHTYAARKIITTCQLATSDHDLCVCVASVLAPVLEEEEEWKERKQQQEIRNNRGKMESVLPVKTFV